MEPTFASHFDALAGWRRGLDRQAAEFARFLADHELLPESAAQAVDGMRQRLASDRLVLAFVAEFSRGKSELINAMFFSDTGRRMLPATPGRTTMCPVELGFEPAQPPLLALLPIETRQSGQTLAELREQPERWTRQRLDAGSPDHLAEAFGELTRTKAVSIDEARALGLWNDERPEDNPPPVAGGQADGLVEVPAWRHAVINYPHPLLRRGLVVLDTPGLNAIGAEPELTLSMLPAAHAVVFLLGADTGVTKSDLSIWNDHLGGQASTRFVVLNKIDTLADPLLPAEAVQAQIARQCEMCASTLGVPLDQVFPLSARQALAARVQGHRAELLSSGLPALEAALGARLLPRRHAVLAGAVVEASQAVEDQAARQISEHRRHVADQLLELRGLRGKSSGRVQTLLARVDAETAEFELCSSRLAALRTVHARLLQDALAMLSIDKLRDEVLRMQQEASATFFNLGTRKAFIALCARLRAQLAAARALAEETRDMLQASCRQLNAEFGFALAVPAAPTLERYVRDLDAIERGYSQYLGLSYALRLSEARYMEQFRRMLLSKLRMAFENAGSDVEQWSRSATAQIEAQLRERRRGFRRRHDALARVQTAAGELEERIGELELQERHWLHLMERLQGMGQALRAAAEHEPEADSAMLPLAAEREPPTLTLVPGRQRAASA
jgi:hypothetical protein